MRVFSLVRMALRNLKKYCFRCMVVMIGLVILQTSLIMTKAYVGMLESRLEQTERAYASASRLSFSTSNQRDRLADFLKAQEDVEEIQIFDSEVVCYHNPNNHEEYPLSFGEVIACIGEKYYGLAKYSSAYSLDGTDFIRYTRYTKGIAVFSARELQEYQYHTGNKEVLRCGRLPESDGEMVLPADILRLYGIDEDQWEGLLGYEFSLIRKQGFNGLDTIKDDSIVFEGMIVGVLKDEVSSVLSKRELTVFQMCDEDTQDTSFTVHAYLKDYDRISEILQGVEKEFGIKGNKNGYCTFCEFIKKQIFFLTHIVTIAVIAFGIAVFVGLICMLAFVTEQKKHYLGMLQAIGYRPKEILFVFAFEIGVVVLMSFMCSVALGLLGTNWFRESMSQFLEMTIPWNRREFINACIETFVVLFGISIISDLYVYYRIHKDRSIELLREE